MGDIMPRRMLTGLNKLCKLFLPPFHPPPLTPLTPAMVTRPSARSSPSTCSAALPPLRSPPE